MKIMLLTAATGGGHLRAAHAVEQYIRNNTDYDVLTVDALKAIGHLLDKTVCDSYLFMAKKTPGLFGKLYEQSNRENRFSSLVPKLSGRFSKGLLPSIEEYAPDAIITTHPFATEMVSNLKEEGLVQTPLVCIITDYGAHRAYIAGQVDAYVVACEDMVAELESLGVAAEKVHPFGIPVHDVFFQKGDRAALFEELGLDPELPTVLFMAGSFGVSNIIKLYRELGETDVAMQVIVITGKNQKLYGAFEKELTAGSPIPTKLVFFTQTVEKYMQVSSLLVTKPGGLTVSEALACGLPMAVFDAIPGQEEDNADFLASHGMCVRLCKEGNFAKEISSLLRETARLSAMRENCRNFDKSRSIPNMLELIRGLVSSAKGGQSA